MTAHADFKADLLGAIPNLRAFALSLTGAGDRADDLVQETLMVIHVRRHTYDVTQPVTPWVHASSRPSWASKKARSSISV